MSLERYENGYRTFHAKEFIAKGTALLEIPGHLLITGNKAAKWLEKNEWIRAEEIARIPGIMLISMYLFVLSKQTDSFWKPYLDVLPASYDLLFLFRDELL